MSVGAAVERVAAAPGVAEQYEMLRTAALGEGLPLQARIGLALFLRRGMWGWAQAAAIRSTPPRPTRSFLATSTASDEQRAVIHLFAAMAMRSTKRRSHERISQSPIASPRT
jgi:hypothetical protein